MCNIWNPPYRPCEVAVVDPVVLFASGEVQGSDLAITRDITRVSNRVPWLMLLAMRSGRRLDVAGV